MAYSNTLTVGTSLKPVRSTWARTLSKAISELVRIMAYKAVADGSAKTLYDYRVDCRVFIKAGARDDGEGALGGDCDTTDSPGQDLCLVWDTTNSDLYLIYSWTAATTWLAVKILD